MTLDGSSRVRCGEVPTGREDDGWLSEVAQGGGEYVDAAREAEAEGIWLGLKGSKFS